MPTVKAGPFTVEAISIYSKIVTHEGALVESLQLSLKNDITEEELEALTTYPWEIYGDTGELQGAHTGINYIKDYTVTFLKIPDVAKLQAQLEKVATETAVLREQLKATEAERASLAEAESLYKSALQRLGVDPHPESVRVLLLDGVTNAI